MIKESNKRITVTLTSSNIIKLKSLMFDLKTRQPSRVINYLISIYNKDK